MEQFLIVNSIVVWLVLLGHFLLTFALIHKVNRGIQPGGTSGYPMLPKEFLKVGQVAPDFAAKTLSGEPVTLADYAGRKVAFIFVSPGCRPCREAVPTLEDLQSKAVQSGVTLLLVIMSDLANAQTFVKEHGVSLPVLLTMPEDKFKNDYKVAGTPFYCLVNEQGQVEATGFFDAVWQSLAGQWSGDSRQDSVSTLALMGHGG